jgi:hypothetical protein
MAGHVVVVLDADSSGRITVAVVGMTLVGWELSVKTNYSDFEKMLTVPVPFVIIHNHSLADLVAEKDI